MDSSKPEGPPLRVLLLAESPYFGGITSHLVTLAEALRQQEGVVPVLACLAGRRPDRTLFERAEARGLEIFEVPMRGRFDIGAMNRLRALADGQRIDLVHTHNYRATLLAAAALRRLPMVVTCHGLVGSSVPLSVRAWQALELRCMRRARAVIACSEQVRRDLLARGLPTDRLHLVRNGVAGPDSSAPIRDKMTLRKSLGIPGDKAVVLFVGRMVEGKGLNLLLQACARRRDWRCVAVGDGPMRGTMEALARQHGLDVLFAGTQTDMTPWYLAADVVALPSRSEAFPMVLLEAAAHRRPVIATDVGGVPEIVTHGKTGLLLPGPGDRVQPPISTRGCGADAGVMDEMGGSPLVRGVADLVAALDLLQDPQARAEMGNNSKTRWEAKFTPAHMAGHTAKIYHAVLKSPFGGGAAKRRGM